MYQTKSHFSLSHKRRGEMLANIAVQYSIININNKSQMGHGGRMIAEGELFISVLQWRVTRCAKSSHTHRHEPHLDREREREKERERESFEFS